MKQWEEKELHGRYPKRIREADVDDYKTNQLQWLRSTGLKAETEGLIISPAPEPPYQVLFCKDCEGRHQSTVQDMPKARRNSLDHIISGCPELAKHDFLLEGVPALQY